MALLKKSENTTLSSDASFEMEPSSEFTEAQSDTLTSEMNPISPKKWDESPKEAQISLTVLEEDEAAEHTALSNVFSELIESSMEQTGDKISSSNSTEKHLITTNDTLKPNHETPRDNLVSNGILGSDVDDTMQEFNESATGKEEAVEGPFNSVEAKNIEEADMIALESSNLNSTTEDVKSEPCAPNFIVTSEAQTNTDLPSCEDCTQDTRAHIHDTRDDSSTVDLNYHEEGKIDVDSDEVLVEEEILHEASHPKRNRRITDEEWLKIQNRHSAFKEDLFRAVGRLDSFYGGRHWWKNERPVSENYVSVPLQFTDGLMMDELLHKEPYCDIIHKTKWDKVVEKIFTPRSAREIEEQVIMIFDFISKSKAKISRKHLMQFESYKLLQNFLGNFDAMFKSYCDDYSHKLPFLYRKAFTHLEEITHAKPQIFVKESLKDSLGKSKARAIYRYQVVERLKLWYDTWSLEFKNMLEESELKLNSLFSRYAIGLYNVLNELLHEKFDELKESDWVIVNDRLDINYQTIGLSNISGHRTSKKTPSCISFENDFHTSGHERVSIDITWFLGTQGTPLVEALPFNLCDVFVTE